MRTKNSILLILILLLTAVSGSGCITTGNGAKPEYQKDGQQYGVTRGLFRSRWWNYYERGRSFADGEYWDEAEQDIRTALAQRERDQLWARTYGLHMLPEYFPRRELGVILYRRGELEAANDELSSSLSQQYSARAAYYLNQVRRELVTVGGLDKAMPEIVVEAQAGPGIVASRTTRLKGRATDDTYVTRIMVAGVEQDVKVAEAAVTFDAEVTLQPGQNSIPIVAEDILGNVREFTAKLAVDVDGPAVSFDGPVHLPGRISGQALDPAGIQSLRIAGKEAAIETLPDGSARFNLDLAAGELGKPPLHFEATDALGNQSQGPLFVDALALALPSGKSLEMLARFAAMHRSGVNAQLAGNTLMLAATQPSGEGLKVSLAGLSDGQRFTMDEIVVQVEVESAAPILSISLDDAPLAIVPGRGRQRLSREVRLAKGDNLIRVRATDEAGHTESLNVTVARVPSPIERSEARLHMLFAGSVFEGNAPALEAEGEYIQAEFEDAITSTDRFFLLDREILPEVLDEQRLRALLGDKDSRIGLGQIAAAEVLLVGKVHHDAGSVEIVIDGMSAETGAYLTRADVAGKEGTPDDLAQLCRLLATRLHQAYPRVQASVTQVNASAAPEAATVTIFTNPGEWQNAGLTQVEMDAFLDTLRAALAGDGRVSVVDQALSGDVISETGSSGTATPDSALVLRGALRKTDSGLGADAKIQSMSGADKWIYTPVADAAETPSPEELAQQLAEAALQYLATLQPPGAAQAVAEISAGFGARDGLVPSAKALVFRDIGPEVDPRNGTVLGRRYEIVGDARLRSVRDNLSTASILPLQGAATTPEVGDVVITK